MLVNCHKDLVIINQIQRTNRASGTTFATWWGQGSGPGRECLALAVLEAHRPDVLGVLMYLFIPRYRTSFQAAMRTNSVPLLSANLLNEVLYMLGTVSYGLAALLAPVALVLLIETVQAIFVFVMAILIARFIPKLATESVDTTHIVMKGVAICIIPDWAPTSCWSRDDGRFKTSLLALGLILGCQFVHAEGVSGEIQVVGYISKDKSVQQSLSTLSAYVEYEIGDEVSVFVVGHLDQEFRSATVGLSRKVGHLQLGLGVGQATFDEMNHAVLNPWAYYAGDDYKGYLHYELYRNGSKYSDLMKGYALKRFDVVYVGVHAETDFGIGPRVEAKLADGLRLWGVVPVARQPTEGAMRAMIGLTAEF